MHQLGWSLHRVAQSTHQEMQHALQARTSSPHGKESRPLFPPTPLRTCSTRGILPYNSKNDSTKRIMCLRERIEKQAQTIQHQKLSISDREFMNLHLQRDKDLLHTEVKTYQDTLRAQQESKKLVLETYRELCEMTRDTHPEWFNEDNTILTQLTTDLEQLYLEYESSDQQSTKQ